MPGTFKREEVIKKLFGRALTPEERKRLVMIAPLSDCLEEMADHIDESTSLVLRRKEPFGRESQYLQELAVKIDLKAARGDLDAAELAQIVNPDDVAEQMRSHVLPGRTIILLEWLRVGLVLLPLVLTCAGIAAAVQAYGDLPANRQSAPFLALWQQGFDGHLWLPGLFRLSTLALWDFSFFFLLLVFALAVHFYSVSRTRWRNRLAEEVRQKLSQERSLLSIDLKPARPAQTPGGSAAGAEMVQDQSKHVSELTESLQQRETESRVVQRIAGGADTPADTAEATRPTSDTLPGSSTTAGIRDDLAKAIREDLLPEIQALGKNVESVVEQHARLLVLDKEAVDEFKKLAAQLDYSTNKLKEGIDIVDPAMQRLGALAEKVGEMVEKQREFLERMTNERKAQEEMTRGVNEMTHDLRERVPESIKKLSQIIEDFGSQIGGGSHLPLFSEKKPS